MRKVIFVGLIPIIITLSTAPSLAEYNFSSGININETYNDNIFLDSVNEEDDFITTVSPHVEFNYSSGKVLDLTLYYGLNFRFYDRHSNLNDEDIDDVQDILVEARITPSHILFIDITDTFDKVPIDARKNSAIDNYNENMTSKNIFRASPHLILPLTGKITATIGYSYTDIWYEDPSSIDSEGHAASLTLGKKFSPRTNSAVKYGYYTYRPDLNGHGSGDTVEEYSRHTASSSFNYQISPSIKINGTLGQTWFDFQTLSDKREFFWNVGIDNIIKITEKTSIGVDYGIHFHDSNTSGASRSQDLNLHYETGKVLKFEVDPYYHEVQHLTSDRKDKFIGVNIGLARPLTKKIQVSASGTWEENKFLNSGEEVHKYSIGGKLNYSLNRWMKMSLGYRFNRQNASSDISNEEFTINDYKNNIGWIQASLTF